jgi:hypothetical protein
VKKGSTHSSKFKATTSDKKKGNIFQAYGNYEEGCNKSTKKTMSIGNYCLMLTAKLRDDPPVARRSAYICFNCSIPGAPIKTTYGINSVLLCNSLRALGAQSRIHIFPGKEINKVVKVFCD